MSVVNVELRAVQFAELETHPVAFAFLIVLVVEGGETGASELLGETLPEIGVRVDAAGQGLVAFGRAYAAHGEGADEVFGNFLLRNSTRLRGR
jgi:hypothetical protein